MKINALATTFPVADPQAAAIYFEKFFAAERKFDCGWYVVLDVSLRLPPN